MDQLLIKNVSGSLVLVGETYLLPGEERTVNKEIVNADDERLTCEPVGVWNASKVDDVTVRSRRSRKTTK